MLLEMTDISVSRGGQTVLSGVSFAVRGTEKIALVGPNGAGKTTLLEVIAGVLEPDFNEKNPLSRIRTSRKLRVEMLGQFPASSEKTAEEMLVEGLDLSELYERERYSFEAEYDRLLTGLGFCPADKKRKLCEFSGGEQKKISLIRILLSRPDILLLDEPVNHLDQEAVEWLEVYLKSYPRCVVMVSHDRYFLDQTAEVIVEVEGKKLTRYPGNYTSYRREKEERIRRQEKAYARQQEEIRRRQELIERFRGKPRKAAFARTQKKRLERMVLIPRPEETEPAPRMQDAIPARQSSRWVLECEDLKIGYDHPLQTVDLRLRRGQRLGILGPNGAGKSTFLKTAAGEIPPLAGRMILGQKVDMAYFTQETAGYESEETLLGWFRQQFPSFTEKESREILAAFCFFGKNMSTPVHSLSGGEKARLKLAVLLLQKPNLLILDEPTSHMDIPSREAVERILMHYQGTIMVVSHDRYFLNKTADSLLIFRKEAGPVRYYPFGYSHYREREAEGIKSPSCGVQREAKRQAMIDSLRAVPEKTSAGFGRISDAAVYRDWRMGLAREEMDAAAEEAERRAEDREAVCFSADEDVQVRADRRLQEAEENWTRACLAWYDAWLETGNLRDDTVDEGSRESAVDKNM